jgi:hypothetical protein
VSNKNTGGPAFPQAFAMAPKLDQGMTLRDYFAAHATIPPNGMQMEDHCAYRYRYADAMLSAREK